MKRQDYIDELTKLWNDYQINHDDFVKIPYWSGMFLATGAVLNSFPNYVEDEDGEMVESDEKKYEDDGYYLCDDAGNEPDMTYLELLIEDFFKYAQPDMEDEDL